MDRPILFSGPMVRALIAGHKTQTRRVITKARTLAIPDAPAFTLSGDELARAMQNASDFRRFDGDMWTWKADAFEHQAPASRTNWHAHLGHAPGDRLWVREAWRCNGWATDVATIFYRASERDGYTAMCEQYPVADHEPLRITTTWRPGIHMPRWASRLTLTVTDVRVERLQDISEEDCIAEGAEISHAAGTIGGPLVYTDVANVYATPRNWYRTLWDSINGAGAWDANPWIVAYSFTVERQNIDGSKR
ncbi:hypothetical protein FG93_01972 [Bosea sp. LC85]|nr:hypothetical protein FG93_01972 [Bosea sp. LC85]